LSKMSFLHIVKVLQFAHTNEVFIKLLFKN
jgi:hypothetical protein